MTQRDDDMTSFGFRKVAASDKAGLVRGVFDSVAARYDVMNDLMSAGVHRIWKSTLLDRLAPQPGQRLIDVAGGTGDISLGFLERANRRPGAAEKTVAQAVVCDINAEMLAAGADRP
ncbi:MAG: class I SAM-dependent methyltransferase, partial [Hyphococcus sp.]